MARYRPGELDQRVELQKVERTSDGQGGFTETWTVVDTVWAHVRPMTGRERQNAERTEAGAEYLVVIRQRSDINETWRIKWINGSRVMNIRFVPHGGGRELYLPIECERGVASG